MADKITEARAVVTMNMEPARDEINKLNKEIADSKKRLEELMAVPEKKRNYKDIHNLEKLIARQEQQLVRANEKLKNFRDTLKHLDTASINKLTNAKKALNEQIRRLTPGTKQWIAATEDYKKVTARLNSVQTAYKEVTISQKGLIGGLKDGFGWFNKYWGGITMAAAAVTGLSTTLRKCSEEVAKLDDTYSDVMKTTGLIRDEVVELDKKLMELDTRTSREQLLLLARDAGKLGITGKENILGFVRAADQIQVALGEDLGEGAIRNLGKISDVLGYTDSMGIEKSLLSIGSAVNAVGQASTASEAYLVDFSQRMAGVAAQAGISAADIIGYASGLDQSAMKVEMASTAFQKFMMKLYEDPAQMAAYANMEVKEFTDLLNNDANQAIITILKSLKDTDGFASMVPVFKDLGLDGARAVSVLAAMASNLDAITDAQQLANIEFSKATSITDEFNTKNNNMQASLEKARKEFNNATIALGESLNPVLLKSTKLTTQAVKLLANYGKEIKSLLITIAALTAVIKANTIAHAAYNAVVKAGQAVKATYTVVTKGLSLAFNVLRGRTIAATKAQIAMNAAMSTSVFGVAATAVSGLVLVITHLVKRQREANEELRYTENLEKKVVDAYADEEGKIRALDKIVHNHNLSLEERNAALVELKRLIPDYHASLIKSGQLVNDNTQSLDEYIKKLKESTRLEIYRGEFQDLETQLVKLEDDLDAAKQKAQDALVAAGGNNARTITTTVDTWGGGIKTQSMKTPYGLAMDEVERLQGKIEELGKKEENVLSKISAKSLVDTKGLSAQQKQIQDIEAKYAELENEIKNDASLTPAEGAKKLGSLYQQKKAEIDAVRKIYSDELAEIASNNEILTQTQFELLEQRYALLTKKEKELVDKGYEALSSDEAQSLKKRYDKIMASDSRLSDKKYNESIKALEAQQRKEENIAKQKYLVDEHNEKEYQKRMLEIKMEFLQKKLELAENEKKDTTKIISDMIDVQIEAQKIANEEIESLMQELEDKSAEEQKRWEQEQRELEENMRRAEDVVAGLRKPKEVNNDEMALELRNLKKLHDAKLLSEKEYEEAVKRLREKYSDEDLKAKLGNIESYIHAVESVMHGASNFVSTMQDADLAKAQANYNRQVAYAGDNAAQREKIEIEYEEKKLEIQKKYADAQMAIGIAEALANGAIGVTRAFRDLPAYAAIPMAAVIAATTAVQIASIIAQRNAIKSQNVSVATSSSGNFSTETVGGNIGTRVVTGYARGGYTEDHTTLTTVGERGTEWIAPHWMVKQNPITFANLESYRRAGSHGRSGSVARGFADGGYTPGAEGGENGFSAQLAATLSANTDASNRLASLIEKGVHAYVVLSELNQAQDKQNRFNEKTSR